MRMLRASMCAMNRSENAGCSCSVRIISRFGMRSTVVGDDRRRRAHAERLAGEASFAEEVARTEHRHDGFLAGRRQHRELHAAVLDVEHAVGLAALGEDDRAAGEADDPPRDAGRVEKRMQIEGKRRPGSTLLHGHDGTSWHKARLDKRGRAAGMCLTEQTESRRG